MNQLTQRQSLKTARRPVRSIRSTFYIFGILTLSALTTGGCVYFNTFYNAKKNFNEAENERKDAEKDGRSRINKGKYQTAIEKSSVVLEKHPDSKYYDDALYVIGVSYYWLDDYFKSQRKFRELLANFEKSEYAAQSRLYLAKCKLQLDERAEAVTIFQTLLSTAKKKEIKAEAAFAIGDYHFELKEFDNANKYYNALLDSLAVNDVQKRRALMRVADGAFEEFDITVARDLYTKVLSMGPDVNETYHASFRIGECDFFLLKVDDGLEMFGKLADDARYFDSIGQIRLQIARGYELNEDLELAIEEYEDVAIESETRPASGTALYTLGLIYQFDYNDLDRALDYYERAKDKGTSRNPYYEESVKRAADISKLATLREVDYTTDSTSDSTADTTGITQERLDKASEAQLKLGELYLLDLNQPDSAISAFKYAVDSFPDAYYTPRALLSMALTYRDYLEDTATYDSLMDIMLERYPESDYYADALETLDLESTAVDSGYAHSYFQLAEDWLIEEGNLDSALFYYQWVVDSFPNSKYVPKAEFSIVWLQDQFENPGDDSLYYFAYADLAERYKNEEIGKLATSMTKAPTTPTRRQTAQSQVTAPGTDTLADTSAVTDSSVAAEETGPFTQEELTLNPELRFYIGPDNQQLRDAPSSPSNARNIDEFIFPATASSLGDVIDLYFQVKLDLDGTVLEANLMNPTQFREYNEARQKIVENYIFNMGQLGDLGYGDGWFVHKDRVLKPDYLR